MVAFLRRGPPHAPRHLAAAAIAAALVPGTASAEIHDSCDNREKFDTELFGLIGVDDPTTPEHNIYGVCVKENFVGVMVERGPDGTCVAVIVNNDRLGCE